MREEIIEEVLRRLEKSAAAKDAPLPNRALLLGREPEGQTGFSYVKEAPYSAVILGSMSPGELLRFPDDVSLCALLEGKPVYLNEAGEDWRQYSKSANRALWGRLLACRRQLGQLGVRPLKPASQKLLTARDVEERLRRGLPIQGRLTPLARDFLEGQE